MLWRLCIEGLSGLKTEGSEGSEVLIRVCVNQQERVRSWDGAKRDLTLIVVGLDGYEGMESQNIRGGSALPNG